MAVAIEGTPSVISDGGSYTAETTGSDRVVAFVIHGVDGSSDLSIGTPTMGSQDTSEAIQGSSSLRVASGVFFVKEADIPTGSQTVTANFNTTPSLGTQITCYTLSSVDQTTPVYDAAEASSGTGSAETISGLTTDSGGICIAGASWNAGNGVFNTDPVSDGYTQVSEAEIGTGGPAGSHYKSTDGTDESFTYAEINGMHAVVGATFRAASAGGTTGYISEGATFSEAFAAVATSAASITAAMNLADTESGRAAAGAGIIAGMAAGDSDGGLGAATALLTTGAVLADAETALVVAVAAISAGLSAGETWAAGAQAIADLTSAAQFGDSYVGGTAGALAGSLGEGLTASDAFIAAVQALASLSDGMSINDALVAVSAANASIVAATTLGSAFTGSAVSALTGALTAGTANSDAFIAAIVALANLTAGATLDDSMVATSVASASIGAGVTFGASFSYGGTLGCLIATITLAAALSASTTLDTAVDGSVTICP